MDNYIFDGEIHPLTEDLAYIIRKIDPSLSDYEREFIKLHMKTDFYKKYAEYIYSFSKEKVIGMIQEKLSRIGGDENFMFIDRDYVDHPMLLYGTFAMKFNRLKDDKLTEMAHEPV